MRERAECLRAKVRWYIETARDINVPIEHTTYHVLLQVIEPRKSRDIH